MEKVSTKHLNNFDLGMQVESTEKITLSQVLENQPPVMFWYFSMTCVSFGFIYTFLFTML